jgi:hypothetical protein
MSQSESNSPPQHQPEPSITNIREIKKPSGPRCFCGCPRTDHNGFGGCQNERRCHCRGYHAE